MAQRLTVKSCLVLVAASLLAAGCRPSRAPDGGSGRAVSATEPAPQSAPAMASAPAVAQVEEAARSAARVTASMTRAPGPTATDRPALTATVAAIPRASLRPTDPPVAPMEPPPAPPTLQGPLAPELDGLAWLNSEPLSMAAQRGKVVMIDFWTFG